MLSMGLLHVVVVADRSHRFDPFHRLLLRAAAAGTLRVHVCVDGRSAIRLARRCRADGWLVATELSDMSGLDLLEMLHRLHVDVGCGCGSAGTSAPGGAARQGAVFMIADSYSMADEQRALAAGAAGYFVQPVGIDVVTTLRRAAARQVPAVPRGLETS